MPLIPGILDIATASDLVDLSIQNKWLKVPVTTWMEKYKQFMNTRTGNMDETVKDTSISGGGSFQRKPEGAVRPKDKPVQGYKKSATMVEYSIQFEVTKRMWIFGIQKNNIEGLVQSYKTMAMERRERDAENRLNNGFATNYTSEEGDTITTTGGDGLSLFSSAHTREDAGTNNNNEIYDGTTYGLPLDYPGLKAMFLTAKNVKSLRGEEMNIQPDTVVVQRGSAAWFRMQEINKSSGIPGSNENDGKGFGDLNVLDLAYLTSSAPWFAFDSGFVNPMYGLQYVETMDINLGPQITNEDTGNFKYNIDAIWEMFHNDYRGWLGSKGTSVV